ncbi:MAG: prolyl oligopeptidase family serine peptidase [Gemmatimonadales bacterium]|jgi:dipeptidyl aminopeptidase/acylaminoacyl peptidase
MTAGTLDQEGTMGQRSARTSLLVLALLLSISAQAEPQTRRETPIRQSELTEEAAAVAPLTLRDAARDDRWFGLGVRDVRWSPDGSVVYFRWNERPSPDDLPAADPWFRAERSGGWVEEVPAAEVEWVPASSLSWDPSERRATWVSGNSVLLFDRGAKPNIRRVVALTEPPRRARIAERGAAIHFEAGEALYRYDIGSGALSVLAIRVTREDESQTEAADWLADQQRELFEHIRRLDDRRERGAALERSAPDLPQSLPVAASAQIDDIQLTPDGRQITFRARTPDRRRPRTQYVDYVDESGYSRVREARSKVGEPRDRVRLGIVRVDPRVALDSIAVIWVELSEAGEQATVPHGPYWNLEGTRAVVPFIGEDHQDLWYAELDVETGSASVITHDHDDAWIGGPPVQANYLQPALLEWLPGDRFVFASERSGWSHLYLAEPNGSISPLTSGEWEVRGAELARDRSFWLLQASREHPADDHLYVLPAGGGELTRITDRPGRSVGHLSPDGERLAVVYSESVQLPDLYVGRVRAHGSDRRITVSGSDAYYEHPLVRPEIISFEHPDGGPLWAALFQPEQPNPERAAVLHIHGGGYRQFAHRGYSVYGYDLHLGFINYLVQQGYTVLDFDYRGSAGYGRDYRTDIARSMGIKDTDGAVAAAEYLVHEGGIDSTRIGIYGVSYGGFLTLMAQFRYPGAFAAGIARAAVTDFAHYSDGWTSRVLGVPHEDPEAYRRSSPIYYADGLQDHLLITHGLVDDNVHFQDAARLVQRLIELEKDFEVMFYPVEPHTIQTEASRYDYVKRAAAFFDRHLRATDR